MPTAAYQECRYPRCPNYAVHRGYCSTHVNPPTQTPGGLNTRNRRFLWLRDAFLKRHPMCNHCKTDPATILDHITPHRGIPMLFWSERNWQALCIHCHGRKTAGETWGNARP